jgi:hypothetical protein
MVLPPASMLPCLAMRKTGSWAHAGKAARTNPAAAEHNKALQGIVILFLLSVHPDA